MKRFREQFKECDPQERLPRIPLQTAVRGLIMIEPIKCIVDGKYCGSKRCPQLKEQP